MTEENANKEEGFYGYGNMIEKNANKKVWGQYERQSWNMT
jgi:hypothetical protein